MTTPPLSQPARPPWAGLGRQPEPLELARWLVEVPEEERAELLARLMHNAARGALCLEAGHDQFPATLHHQSEALRRELETTATARAQGARYRLAWLSARRRAQQTADALALFDEVPIPVTYLHLDETTETVEHRPLPDLEPPPGETVDRTLMHRPRLHDLVPASRDNVPTYPCTIRPGYRHTSGRCNPIRVATEEDAHAPQ